MRKRKEKEQKKVEKETNKNEERKPLDLVPAPAVRLMKRRVLSRPGLKSLMLAWLDVSSWTINLWNQHVITNGSRLWSGRD